VSCPPGSAAGTPGEALAQQQQQRVRNAADMFQAAQLCYTTVLGDVDLVEECLAFYRSGSSMQA